MYVLAYYLCQPITLRFKKEKNNIHQTLNLRLGFLREKQYSSNNIYNFKHVFKKIVYKNIIKSDSRQEMLDEKRIYSERFDQGIQQ